MALTMFSRTIDGQQYVLASEVIKHMATQAIWLVEWKRSSESNFRRLAFGSEAAADDYVYQLREAGELVGLSPEEFSATWSRLEVKG